MTPRDPQTYRTRRKKAGQTGIASDRNHVWVHRPGMRAFQLQLQKAAGNNALLPPWVLPRGVSPERYNR